MARSKKRFSEYPPAKQLLIVIVTTLSFGLVALAERDIQRRPADQIRGSRALWRLICTNALGALGYLSWGRRTAPTL